MLRNLLFLRNCRLKAVLAAAALSCVLYHVPVSAEEEFGWEADEIDASLDAELESATEEKKQGDVPLTQREELKALSDLATLAPFKDVAVIQRIYFSKTSRWEAYLAGTAVMNDAFFLNAGGNFRLAYYFSESWGLEASVLGLFGVERQVTEKLGRRGVITSSLVSPKLYTGLDLKWTPVYGKMAFKDRRIIPFDLYFSLGGGLTQTNLEGEGGSAPTVHIGSGQSFAISRSFAFRWDFSWNFFTPQRNEESSTDSGTFSNLFLTLGFSYYFPETEYR